MTPTAEGERLESVSKVIGSLLLGAEVGKLGAKKLFLSVSIKIYKFALWLLFYSLYKAAKKGGYELELEDVLEAEILKILEGRQYNKEELITLVRSIAPPWSKELKRTLENVALEAFETYELKKFLKSNEEALNSFLSQVKNATDNTPQN